MYRRACDYTIRKRDIELQEPGDAYHDNFVETPTSELFSQHDPILERFRAVRERIEECHRRRAGLPDTLFLAAEFEPIIALSVAGGIGKSQGS
jgi:hypothetical protein